jgi:hypothetical protein
MFDTGSGLASRFGTGVDQRSRACLAGVGDECRAAAEQEARDLPLGIATIDDRHRQQGAADRPDHRVHGVPGAVDPRHLIREEFRQRADTRDPDQPVVGEDIERLQLVGQRNPAQLHCEAGDEADEIEPPAG